MSKPSDTAVAMSNHFFRGVRLRPVPEELRGVRLRGLRGLRGRIASIRGNVHPRVRWNQELSGRPRF